MRAYDRIRSTLSTLAARVAGWGGERAMSCGECARSERCGLQPSENCVDRAEQEELNRGYQRRTPEVIPL